MTEQDESPVSRIEGPSEALAFMRLFAERARLSIDIFSHQLTPLMYEDEQLAAAISALARRHAQTKVRILVKDPLPLYDGGHVLLKLVRRLPSHASMKVYTEGASDPKMGFLCADHADLVFFNDESNLQGFARGGARAEARHYMDEFNHLWHHGSKNDTNLRSLTL